MGQLKTIYLKRYVFLMFPLICYSYGSQFFSNRNTVWMKNKHLRKDCDATSNKLAPFYYERRVTTVSSYLMVFSAADLFQQNL